MNKTLTTLLFSFLLLLITNYSIAAAALDFKNAWISQAPPVSKVLAAYMTIINDSDKTISIESITSSDFDKVEFHRTIHENGIAKMRQQATLPVPANSELELKPGSYHLMLFNPARNLLAGDQSVFIVQANNGDKIEIIVPVVKAGNNDTHNNHDHHHHH